MSGDLETSVPTDVNRFDVVIVGSGPAGIAVAERLHARSPTATIGIVERGSVLLRRHFYDDGGSIQERDAFLARHRYCPWRGDLSGGGTLLPGLGGRGLVGGAQLHRFRDTDMMLWDNGRWPVDAKGLEPYFRLAEQQLLGARHSAGPAQAAACQALANLDAQHPPWAEHRPTVAGPAAGYPHRSGVERLLALVERDREDATPRLTVLTDTRVVRLLPEPHDSELVSRVRCVRVGRSSTLVDLIAGTVVLAASPVESARLVLVSDLESLQSDTSAVGRYLAEHIYIRGTLDVSGNRQLGRGPINVFVPPPGDALAERFQLELRTMAPSGDSPVLVRAMGSAAMDPAPDNRVTLDVEDVDELGVPRAHTRLVSSEHDVERTVRMRYALDDVAARLGGVWTEVPVLLPRGSSQHEVGTLRSGASGQEVAADEDGRLLGTRNVFVGDGAAFTSVGVSNPILTLTAMGYRLADRLTGGIESG